MAQHLSKAFQGITDEQFQLIHDLADWPGKEGSNFPTTRAETGGKISLGKEAIDEIINTLKNMPIEALRAMQAAGWKMYFPERPGDMEEMGRQYNWRPGPGDTRTETRQVGGWCSWSQEIVISRLVFKPGAHLKNNSPKEYEREDFINSFDKVLDYYRYILSDETETLTRDHLDQLFDDIFDQLKNGIKLSWSGHSERFNALESIIREAAARSPAAEYFSNDRDLSELTFAVDKWVAKWLNDNIDHPTAYRKQEDTPEIIRHEVGHALFKTLFGHNNIRSIHVLEELYWRDVKNIGGYHRMAGLGLNYYTNHSGNQERGLHEVWAECTAHILGGGIQGDTLPQKFPHFYQAIKQFWEAHLNGIDLTDAQNVNAVEQKIIAQYPNNNNLSNRFLICRPFRESEMNYDIRDFMDQPVVRGLVESNDSLRIFENALEDIREKPYDLSNLTTQFLYALSLIHVPTPDSSGALSSRRILHFTDQIQSLYAELKDYDPEYAKRFIRLTRDRDAPNPLDEFIANYMLGSLDGADIPLREFTLPNNPVLVATPEETQLTQAQTLMQQAAALREALQDAELPNTVRLSLNIILKHLDDNLEHHHSYAVSLQDYANEDYRLRDALPFSPPDAADVAATKAIYDALTALKKDPHIKNLDRDAPLLKSLNGFTESYDAAYQGEKALLDMVQAYREIERFVPADLRAESGLDNLYQTLVYGLVRSGLTLPAESDKWGHSSRRYTQNIYFDTYKNAFSCIVEGLRTDNAHQQKEAFRKAAYHIEEGISRSFDIFRQDCSQSAEASFRIIVKTFRDGETQENLIGIANQSKERRAAAVEQKPPQHQQKFDKA